MDDDQDDFARRAEDEIFDEGKERARRGGGGKLSRSETVTVRLDPRLNYLTELAARAQRRTKSSFVEWAVETVLDEVSVPGTGGYNAEPSSIEDLASSLWDVDEADRLANLALYAPILLTHEEQVLWKVICNYIHVWRGGWRSINESEEEWTYDIDPQSLIRDRLRDTYEQIKRVAQGEMSPSQLQFNRKRRPKIKAQVFDTDLDDDVPF